MLIRPALPDDALDVARVHVRAWQVGYRGLLPDEYLDALRPEQRAQRYDFATQDSHKPATLVAVTQGAIRGFATVAPARDSDRPEHGELCALYVDPDWWGHGIGAALIAVARKRLFAHGFRYANLWVLAGNARAERFYRKDGWQPDGHRRIDQVWAVTVDEIRYHTALDQTPALM
jgi:GNAT superfamily N-acetyltransferase